MSSGFKEATQRPATVWQTLRAVAWAFFGVRRSADHAQDVRKINPVVAGLFSAAIFVLALVLLVQWVIGSGVAA